MTHRSFASRAERDPFTFDIDGEEFHSVTSLSGADVLEMAILGGASFYRRVFELSIAEEDAERFAKCLRSPKGPDYETLVEIGDALFEHLTGNPEKTSSGS